MIDTVKLVDKRYDESATAYCVGGLDVKVDIKDKTLVITVDDRKEKR